MPPPGKSVTSVTFDVDQEIQPIYTGGDVALDATGRLLLTCLGEEALVSELTTGKVLLRVEGDGEVLTACLLTPQASHLITCSRSLSTRFYRLDPKDDSPELSATLIKTIKPHKTPVITARVDGTGTLLATGSADGSIKVWDIRGGYMTHTFSGHSGIISALEFYRAEVANKQPPTKSKQNKRRYHETNGIENGEDHIAEDVVSTTFRLASGGDDGQIRIWDLTKRKAIATLSSHVSVVRSLRYSEIRGILLSASRDKTFILWDASTFKEIKVVPILESLEVAGFICDDKLIYTGGEHDILRIWDVESGAEKTEVSADDFDDDEDASISQVVYNDRTKSLLVVHADQSLVIHDTTPLEGLQPGQKTGPLPESRRLAGTHDEVIDLGFAGPDHSLLALATNTENLILVHAKQNDSEDEETPGSYFGSEAGTLVGHEDVILCLTVDSTGSWIATGAKDNTVRVWRIDPSSSEYDCAMVLSGHAESIGGLAFSPSTAPPENGLSSPPTFLMTGSQDKTIKRWEIARNMAKEDGKNIRATFTKKAHEKDINALAMSSNGTIFASASQDRLVKIWSSADGEAQGVFRGHKRGVWSVTFAPATIPSISIEGKTISSRDIVLTGAGDKIVKLWNLNDYSCLRTFEGHTNSVLKVLWVSKPPEDSSNDEDMDVEDARPRAKDSTVLFASAGGDGLVKIWDAAAEECLATLDNHTDRVWALATNPDGALISGGGDGVVTFWKNTTSTTLATQAAESTARIEQEQEMANYISTGNYRDAIVLALQLNHPHRLLNLFTSVIDSPAREEGSKTGLFAVDEVLSSLSDDQLFTLLLRLRDWNTNTKTARVAQEILFFIFRTYKADRILALRGPRGGKGRQLEEVFDALRVYTERHRKRTRELMQESYMLDLLVRKMGVTGFVDQVAVDVDEEEEEFIGLDDRDEQGMISV